jgi:site-specific DNA-methyltransferase (adenine-specific)
MHLSRTFNTRTSKPITVHHQDCFEGLSLLKNGSISLVITSPPYNLGIQYGTYNDSMSRDDYLDWIERWCVIVEQKLAGNGSAFVNVGSAPRDPYIAMDVAARIGRHLTLQNVFHWIKAISIDSHVCKNVFPGRSHLNFGHFKPINSKRFVNDCHEFVFHFTHDGKVTLDRTAIGVPYTDKSNITRWQSVEKDVRCRGNTWFIPYQTIRSRKKDRPHPATFPEELAELCIRLHGIKQAECVVDPFMGIGTTALACSKLDVACIGFEIDETYFSESVNRLEARLNVSRGQAALWGDT